MNQALNIPDFAERPKKDLMKIAGLNVGIDLKEPIDLGKDLKIFKYL